MSEATVTFSVMDHLQFKIHANASAPGESHSAGSATGIRSSPQPRCRFHFQGRRNVIAVRVAFHADFDVGARIGSDDQRLDDHPPLDRGRLRRAYRCPPEPSRETAEQDDCGCGRQRLRSQVNVTRVSGLRMKPESRAFGERENAFVGPPESQFEYPSSMAI